jgi:hypothetical protein
MRRAKKSQLSLSDLIATTFDAAGEAEASPYLAAAAVTRALLRSGNRRAVARLLEAARALS